MKAESIVFAVAGMCFGVILGWVLATQQQGRVQPAPAAQTAAAAQQGTQTGQQAPALDEARVQGLETILKSDPKNAGALAQLGNTYYDAQRYTEAITYYEQALAIDGSNIDVSTDLGVSYYYTNRPDDAIRQFDTSLKLNPRHVKTLLNKGIVLAFGKQDLDGAAALWNQVVAVAPGSPEAEAAQRGLEGITASKGAAASSSAK